MKIFYLILSIVLLFGTYLMLTKFSESNQNNYRIVLIGPPASGKGTQAAFLSEKLNIPAISSGDLLRSEIAKGSPFGKELENIMKAGQLVPAKQIAELIQERLKKEDCKNGFILDGFPRNIEQAKILGSYGIKINTVININVNDDIVKKRITGRRIHLPSGRSYHLEFNPPKKEGLDDVTGEALVQRKDDTLEVISKRLETYHTQTKPLLTYYKENDKIHFIEVNGALNIKDIQQSLINQLHENNKTQH